MKGFTPTLADVEAHQRKHGFKKPPKQANAEPISPVVTSEASARVPIPEKGVQSRGGPGKRRKVMNYTEQEFARMLDMQVKTFEIKRWAYEAITLRWGELDNIQYTPDFTVHVDSVTGINFRPDMKPADPKGPYICLRFIEVKGAQIWAADIAKFKAARNQFPFYEFQLWQKKNREWTQLY